jgi:hypothetical protein
MAGATRDFPLNGNVKEWKRDAIVAGAADLQFSLIREMDWYVCEREY